MVRIGGVLALLASLGLAGLLALGLQRHSFSGEVGLRNDANCGFSVQEPSELSSGSFSRLPELPRTFPREATFSHWGTKGDPEVFCILQLPSELRGKARNGMKIEIRHDCLVLPVVGSVAGQTRIRIGSNEWRDDPWRLRGAVAGLALLPLLAGCLVTIPALLLRKKSQPA